MNENYGEYFSYLQKRSKLGYLYRNYLLYPKICSHIDGKVLDVGCGYGYVAFKVAEKKLKTQVTGVDRVIEKVNFAKNEYKLPNLNFISGDVINSEFSDKYDFIFLVLNEEEIQAAIGRIQLQKMNQWTKKRNRNQNAIWKNCRSLNLIRTPEFNAKSWKFFHEGNIHAAYKCYIFINKDRLKSGWSRDKIIKEISEKA